MNKKEEFIMKPKVDFCFKELMADEEIRRGFISAVLGVSPEIVVRSELLPTHLSKVREDDKLGILDVRVLLNGEIQIDMEIHTDKFELHIMELPKLAKYEYPQTELLNWAKFLNAERKEELEMIAKTNDYMGKAYERLTNISADEEKRLEYEAREKALRDYNYLMQSNLKAGLEKGRAQGLAEGRVQGIIEILQEEGVSYEETEARLMQKFSISKEEAVKCLKKYWKING